MAGGLLGDSVGPGGRGGLLGCGVWEGGVRGGGGGPLGLGGGAALTTLSLGRSA